MDFTAPSFSLGFDSDDDDPPPPAGSGPREQPRGYAAPDAPSFSLGIDFVDDVEEEPRPRAGGRREEQARGSAVPDPPSFSLGFDDDDDDLAAKQRHEQARPQVAPQAPPSAGAEDEDDDFVLAGSKQPPPETNRFKRLRKGPAPAHPAPTPQVRRCEAPDAPSFSLGISDDDEEFLADGQHHKQSRPPAVPRAPSSFSFEDEADFFIAGDQRAEPARIEATPLKRLQKGPVLPYLAPAPPPLKVPGPPTAEVSPVMSENGALGAVGTGSLEDEIEDCTTDEDRPMRDAPPSVGSCSTSSNSKFSLLNRGVLMTQSATKAKTSKFTQTSNSSASKSLEESCTKKLLPKITISPMRKIHLLDSDTDVDDEQNQNKAKKPVSPVKKRQDSMHKYMQEKPTLQQNSKPQGSTTVQKSEATMNDNWATPAFDEFCNEYFKSTNDAGSSQQKEGNSFRCSKVSQPKYTVGEMEGHFQQQSTSSGDVLDDNLDGHPPAMHYFFHHDPRVRDLVRDRLHHFFPIGAGSTRVNEQSRGESLSYRRRFSSSTAANNDWVTPNGRIPVPTDVGKRRVHASGTQSGSGHWFTSDNGKKVYVSKNGQELTGRGAYRQYKKESGRGFNRYRKKGSSGTKQGAAKVKVETAAKQGSSRGRGKRKR
ncbi:hypothetical protein PAHAL_7G297900 [Panicum hallii]|uniref:Uncharacterized protein n=1 Tax=Panicum hallii TaxID=206008 RepID=A0A2S3IAK5_9POAL|nr:nucleolar and coiled-body phosphoprotein 1 [Panicum hallii]PAN40184.1 hypothetical protein PAHAL_7G297900 [Panicum hallii]